MTHAWNSAKQDLPHKQKLQGVIIPNLHILFYIVPRTPRNLIDTQLQVLRHIQPKTMGKLLAKAQS